jgi:hypothetical protein
MVHPRRPQFPWLLLLLALPATGAAQELDLGPGPDPVFPNVAIDLRGRESEGNARIGEGTLVGTRVRRPPRFLTEEEATRLHESRLSSHALGKPDMSPVFRRPEDWPKEGAPRRVKRPEVQKAERGGPSWIWTGAGVLAVAVLLFLLVRLARSE